MKAIFYIGCQADDVEKLLRAERNIEILFPETFECRTESGLFVLEMLEGKGITTRSLCTIETILSDIYQHVGWLTIK